jgi:hypothetical protein
MMQPKLDSPTIFFARDYGESLVPGTMRKWFVALLFAIVTPLYVHQGHSRKQDVAFNFAGLLAVGTAFFPMSWDYYHLSFSPHGFCAISFFP